MLQKLLARHLGALGKTQNLPLQPVQPLIQHFQLRHQLLDAVIMQPHLLNLGHQLVAQLFIGLFGARIHIATRRQIIQPLLLDFRQLLVKLLDILKIREDFGLQLLFQRRQRHPAAIALFVVVQFLGRGKAFRHPRLIAGLHRFQVNNVTQQHPPVIQRLMPGDNGAERQRAFAQPADHHVPPGLYPLGDRNFALAREQLHRAHFAQIHTHRVIGTADRALGNVACRGLIVLGSLFLGRGRGLGVLAFLALHHLDAHLREHRHDVLDLLGGVLLRRQDSIQLIKGDVAALLTLGDQPLNGSRLCIEHIGIGFGFGGGGLGGGGGRGLKCHGQAILRKYGAVLFYYSICRQGACLI